MTKTKSTGITTGMLMKIEARAKKEGRQEAIKEIVEMIEKQIEIQKSFNKNEFEADKSRNWRIIGFELLIKKIKELK